MMRTKKSIFQRVASLATKELLKAQIALVYLLHIFSSRSDKTVVLFGEKDGKQFQDNSFAFFSYLFEKGRRDIFFVIDRAAINAATSQRFGRNIVAYRSFRHILLIYRAKFLIINDGYRDVYPSGSLLRSMNTPFIYLQHGILRY